LYYGLLETITTVKQPIFIIGCPRSGTGILHNLMKFHSDIAYTTPSINAFLSLLNNINIEPHFGGRWLLYLDYTLKNIPPRFIPRFLRGPYDGSIEGDLLPDAVEDYCIWQRFEEKFKDYYLAASDVTSSWGSFIESAIQFHLACFSRSRYLSKRPSNSLRISFISKIFPDSQFIHFIRDGRAVANSLLQRRQQTGKTNWWGAKPPGWKRMLDKPPIVQCGWQWQTIVDIVARDAQAFLDEQRYLQISYENLMANPFEVLESVLAFCRLDVTEFAPSLERYASQLQSRNYKWKTQLSTHHQSLLESTIGDTLHAYGYA